MGEVSILHAHQIKPTGRCHNTRRRPVLRRQNILHTLWCALAKCGFHQCADHVAYLVVEEGFGAEAHHNLLRIALTLSNLQRIKRLDRRFRLAVFIAETGKIMRANKVTGGQSHRIQIKLPMHLPGAVHWWDDVISGQDSHAKPEPMDAEDPLFILYTSGSTGKPKGLMHTTGGYMVWAATTTKYVFDLKPNDIYWCTADVGWITGHSYIIYGPLANGATTLMFEGVPNYPDASRFWQVVDAHQVTKFYTAPTAVRALMAQGDEFVKKTSRKSLKLLASVGEPINPEAWLWFYRVVGEERCPVIDTWWQTETGGHMLTPLPGATPLKPGSCTLPFFGVQPVMYDTKGQHITGEGEGQLCIADSWPGQARSIWGDHKRFKETYFSQVPGHYFTSDGCRRDADGYYWITGRVDDVINVSGHRLGTAEVESALVAHHDVVEAAVVGYPHDIKGQGVYAYVTLNEGVAHTEELQAELKQWVRKHIGGLAVPDYVHLTPGLPKTRSGKIMRRILRKIAENELESLGDTSTLLNPEVVEQLIAGRMNNLGGE